MDIQTSTIRRIHGQQKSELVVPHCMQHCQIIQAHQLYHIVFFDCCWRCQCSINDLILGITQRDLRGVATIFTQQIHIFCMYSGKPNAAANERKLHCPSLLSFDIAVDLGYLFTGNDWKLVEYYLTTCFFLQQVISLCLMNELYKYLLHIDFQYL